MSRKHVQADIEIVDGAMLPGERVTLRFRVDVREPVTIRGAHARFEGYVETKATYTTTDSDGDTRTRTATERDTLFSVEKTFQGREPAGFFANVADAAMTLLGGGEHIELRRGSHDVEVSVDLPQELPEPLEVTKVTIAYVASVHLDVPAGLDFRHGTAFGLAGPPADEPAPEPTLIRYPEDLERGFFDRMFGPEVRMRVSLDSAVVRRGGTLRGELEVRFPDKPPEVRAVVTSLWRCEQSRAQSHSDSARTTVAERRDEQRPATGSSLFVPIELDVPEDLAPTCAGRCFEVSHVLAIALDVPWATDPMIRIPVRVV